MKKCHNKELSLEAKFPSLLLEWDYDKNYLLPSSVFPCARLRVWWKCKKGHSWNALLYSRTSPNGKSGCPFCSGRRVDDSNSLFTLNPNGVMSEWDYDKNIIDPKKVTIGSNLKVFWKCQNGHEWNTKINGRSRGSNCPICSKRKIVDRNNCLEATNPEILSEWDYDKNSIKPNEVTYGMSRKIWWKCKKGHSWDSNIINRIKGCGCPYCSGYRVCDDNCLSTTHPNLILEWDYDKNNLLTPEAVTAGSTKKVWWKCSNGHEWESQILSRNAGSGCPYCIGFEFCDGMHVSSLVEAWYYLMLKNNNIKFEYNKKYNIDGLGKHRFDFYIPEIKTYIEVTGFMSDMKHNGFNYDNYLKNIDLKRKSVESFGCNFEFIQKKLNRVEVNYIRGYLK